MPTERFVQEYLFCFIHKGQQLKGPSTGEWINKLWYMFTMEYNSAVKQDEPLTCTTRINLKHTSSERSQL